MGRGKRIARTLGILAAAVAVVVGDGLTANRLGLFPPPSAQDLAHQSPRAAAYRIQGEHTRAWSAESTGITSSMAGAAWLDARTAVRTGSEAVYGYAVDTGAERWTFTPPHGTELCGASPSAARGVGVVMLTRNNLGGGAPCDRLAALDTATGRVLWTRRLDSAPRLAAVAVVGAIVVTADSRRPLLFRARTGEPVAVNAARTVPAGHHRLAALAVTGRRVAAVWDDCRVTRPCPKGPALVTVHRVDDLAIVRKAVVPGRLAGVPDYVRPVSADPLVVEASAGTLAAAAPGRPGPGWVRLDPAAALGDRLSGTAVVPGALLAATINTGVAGRGHGDEGITVGALDLRTGRLLWRHHLGRKAQTVHFLPGVVHGAVRAVAGGYGRLAAQLFAFPLDGSEPIAGGAITGGDGGEPVGLRINSSGAVTGDGRTIAVRGNGGGWLTIYRAAGPPAAH